LNNLERNQGNTPTRNSPAIANSQLRRWRGERRQIISLRGSCHRHKTQ
jgi:hypothetical protein